MRNQYEQVPDHLQPEWQAVSDEVREASEELQKAQKRYNQAVLARIAMTDAVNKAWAEF